MNYVWQAIKFNKLCCPTSTALWHDSDSNVVLLLHQTEFTNCVTLFWWDCVSCGELLYKENCLNVASVNPEFGTTLAQCLNHICVSAMLQLNLTAIIAVRLCYVQHVRDMMSELG